MKSRITFLEAVILAGWFVGMLTVAAASSVCVVLSFCKIWPWWNILVGLGGMIMSSAAMLWTYSHLVD